METDKVSVLIAAERLDSVICILSSNNVCSIFAFTFTWALNTAIWGLKMNFIFFQVEYFCLAGF